MQKALQIVVLIVLPTTLHGCQAEDAGTGSAPAPFDDCFECPKDVGPVDTGGGSDQGEDPRNDPDVLRDPTPEPVDDALEYDAFLEDSFVRPHPDTLVEVHDEPLPDPVTEVRGFHDCYEYELAVTQTLFTVKEDAIPVTYEIHNTCQTRLRVRTRHQSDFFAVGIQKNGEPWIFLPDCPGTGPPEEQVFGPGDGWGRGWIWTPTDFDARLARCGVEFEQDAEYAVVGYGLEPVPFGDPTAWSDIYPMTEAIPIRLLR